MVTDLLANAAIYRPLGARIARAFDYLATTDCTRLADGRYPISDDEIFALVQRYTTKPLAAGRWEAHRRYIDLQVVLAGTERIGYAPIGTLRAEPYDADRDLLWLAGDGSFVTIPAGGFAILWPDDAHMPQIAVDAPAAVTKVVIKIAAD